MTSSSTASTSRLSIVCGPDPAMNSRPLILFAYKVTPPGCSRDPSQLNALLLTQCPPRQRHLHLFSLFGTIINLSLNSFLEAGLSSLAPWIDLFNFCGWGGAGVVGPNLWYNGRSKAKGQIRAAATSRCHAGSEPRLRPTPQLSATHTRSLKPGIKPLS